MRGTRLAGSCHCGNLRFVFESPVAPGQLPVRACACRFCRGHGARTVSDPRGQVRLAAADEGDLSRYRFGLETADFLVCRRCGVYVSALMTAGGRMYATVNINSAEPAAPALGEPTEVSYAHESASQRRTRRAARWTPVAAFEAGSGEARQIRPAGATPGTGTKVASSSPGAQRTRR